MTTEQIAVGISATVSRTIICPGGKRAMAGGYEPLFPTQALRVLVTRPGAGGAGWEFVFRNEGPDADSRSAFRAYAVCARG